MVWARTHLVLLDVDVGGHLLAVDGLLLDYGLEGAELGEVEGSVGLVEVGRGMVRVGQGLDHGLLLLDLAGHILGERRRQAEGQHLENITSLTMSRTN